MRTILVIPFVASALLQPKANAQGDFPFPDSAALWVQTYSDPRPRGACARQHPYAVAWLERPLHRPEACHLPCGPHVPVLQPAAHADPLVQTTIRGERVTGQIEKARKTG